MDKNHFTSMKFSPLKSSPKAFTRPDGEQDRQQCMWKFGLQFIFPLLLFSLSPSCSERRDASESAGSFVAEALEKPASPRRELLYGVWHTDATKEIPEFELKFEKNGSTSFMDKNPFLVTIGYRGTFTLSGDQLVVTVVKDDKLAGFSEGETFTSTVLLLNAEELHLQSVGGDIAKYRRR